MIPGGFLKPPDTNCEERRSGKSSYLPITAFPRKYRVKTMLCSNCGKSEAAVYINKTVNGKTTSAALCRACAAKLGIGGLGLLSGLDLLGMLGGSQKTPRENAPAPTESAENRQPSKRCSACGRSFDEIAASGRVGCAVCYKSFASELGGTITGIHGIASYVGRRPGGREPLVEPLEDIIKEPVTEKSETGEVDLRQKLLDAVRDENYEEAARLRDLIRAHENEAKENAGEGN